MHATLALGQISRAGHHPCGPQQSLSGKEMQEMDNTKCSHNFMRLCRKIGTISSTSKASKHNKNYSNKNKEWLTWIMDDNEDNDKNWDAWLISCDKWHQTCSLIHTVINS